MATPPKKRRRAAMPDPMRQARPTPATLALLNELAEALTATAMYVKAAERLADPELTEAPARLREAIGKGLAQTARANDLYRRLRAALRGPGEEIAGPEAPLPVASEANGK